MFTKASNQVVLIGRLGDDPEFSAGGRGARGAGPATPLRRHPAIAAVPRGPDSGARRLELNRAANLSICRAMRRRGSEDAESRSRKRGAGRASRPMPLRSMGPPHPRPARPAPRQDRKARSFEEGGSRETPPPPLRAGATGLPRRCTDLWRMSSPIWSILPLTLLAERPASGPGHPATCRSLRSCRGSRRRDARRTVQPAVGGQGEEANRRSDHRARPRPNDLVVLDLVGAMKLDAGRGNALTKDDPGLPGSGPGSKPGEQAVLGKRLLREIAV